MDVTSPLRAWLGFEFGLARAVLLWARGRQDGVGPGNVPLTYAAGASATGPILIGLAVVEILVVELVVPWPVVRTVLLLLGVWSLALVVGLVAAERTRPHVVRADGLLLRAGALVRLWLPWGVVAGVRRRTRHEVASWAVEDGRLHLPVGGTTVIDIDLAEPVEVRLPWRRTATVTALSIAVDDAALALGAMEAARIAAG